MQKVRAIGQLCMEIFLYVLDDNDYNMILFRSDVFKDFGSAMSGC